MAATTGISSTTAAGTSSDITLADGASIQIWTYPLLGAGEKVSIWRTTGGSPANEIRVQEGGGLLQLGSGINQMKLTGPGTFRLKKTVTAVATTVYYDA